MTQKELMHLCFKQKRKKFVWEKLLKRNCPTRFAMIGVMIVTRRLSFNKDTPPLSRGELSQQPAKRPLQK